MAFSVLLLLSIHFTVLILIHAEKPCLKSPPVVRNALRPRMNTTHGSIVEYTCRRNFKKKLQYYPQQITCIDGEWKGQPPTCYDIRCYISSFREEGLNKTGKTIYLHKEVFEPSCIAGYQRTVSNVQCSLGIWTSLPRSICVPEKCIVPNVENGVIRIQNNRSYEARSEVPRSLQIFPLRVKNGTELYLTCYSSRVNRTRIPSKVSRISCVDGVWSPKPTCMETESALSQSAPEFCQNDRFRCKNGECIEKIHHCDGQSHCNDNSDEVDWEMKCKIPKDLSNGTVHYDSLKKGSELYYKCNEGFQLDVIQNRTCTDDGKWSGEEPSCRAEMKCEVPKDLPNGTVYYDSLKKDSDLYYECNEGFQLDFIQTRTCSDDGKWSGEEPSCREPCTIPKVENGIIGEYKKMYKYEGGIKTEMVFSESVVHSRAKNDTKLLFKCTDSRFEPVGAQAKEVNITCINGIWSHQLICNTASCRKPPPEVENAVIVTKGITNGTILRYVCAKHFRKISFEAVICQYGEWTGQAPICKDTRCHTKDIRPDDRVDIKPSETVISGNYADISCKEKYYLKYEKPKCLDGTWSYQNDSSPCQIQDHCIVPDIRGRFLRPNNYLPYGFRRFRNDFGYSNVNPGERVENGKELSVVCNPSHTFPGAGGNSRFNRVSCVEAEWQPTPICKPDPIDPPPSPILTDVKSSTTSISFAWEFPSKSADSIDGYVLSYEEKGKEIKEKTETLIGKLHRNYTIKNLEPSKEYQITLQAYKSDVRSQPASSLVKTSLENKAIPAATACSIISLMENLPEDIVIDIENEKIISDTVLEGTVLRLTCGTTGMHPIGERFATCDSDGRWKTAKDLECIIACGPIRKPASSSLTIHPEKDMYRFGETVIFSCPVGQSLNSTTVRIMCLRGRWSSESVPHCE